MLASITPGQENAVLAAAADSRSPLLYPWVQTLGWTGMRKEVEALKLRWRQVDFDGAGDITVGDSKTEAGKGRRIPMSANLKAVSTQHAAWYESKSVRFIPSGSCSLPGNRFGPFDPTKPVGSLMSPWYTALKKAKVKCRPHDLRHTFCTKMAEAGVPESTMLDIMGHMSTAMLRRYSHIRAKARREAMDARIAP